MITPTRFVAARTALLLSLSTWGLIEASHASSISPSWTSSNRQRLASGGVAVFHPSSSPSTGARLAGASLVDATRVEVWTVISNPGAQPQFLSNVKRADVTQTSSRTQLVDHKVKVGLLPMTLSYRYQTRQIPHQRIDFNRISGDLRGFEGRWMLYDASSLIGKPGTVVFYELYLDPGKLLPQDAVRKNLQKDLPDMLARVRDRVYSVRSRT